MMQHGPHSDLTAKTATMHVLNNILNNSDSYEWLTSFADRNAVSITGLIEGDTFGELSDFPEQYPNAGLQDQLNILKAFIEDSALPGFDVPAITQMLKTFLDTVADRERHLETALFNAQWWRREIPWHIKLSTNLRASLKTLDQIQILNYIEKKALEAAPSEQTACQEILDWAKTKQAALCDHMRPASYAESEYAYFFVGANRFSKLIRNEINAFIDLFNKIKSTVNAVATFNQLPLWSLLSDGFLITIRLGLTFLLPWRLLLTACQEGNYFVRRAVIHVGRYLAPNSAFVQNSFYGLSLLVGLYLACQYFPYFPWLMVCELQLFPNTWSWSFIFSTSLTLSAAEFVTGVALGIGQRLVAFARPASNNNPLAFADAGQRQALLTILRHRLEAQDITLEERQEIGAELNALYNPRQPYPISQRDLALLRTNAAENNNTLPPVFEPLRDHILSRACANFV